MYSNRSGRGSGGQLTSMRPRSAGSTRRVTSSHDGAGGSGRKVVESDGGAPAAEGIWRRSSAGSQFMEGNVPLTVSTSIHHNRQSWGATPLTAGSSPSPFRDDESVYSDASLVSSDSAVLARHRRNSLGSPRRRRPSGLSESPHRNLKGVLQSLLYTSPTSSGQNAAAHKAGRRWRRTRASAHASGRQLDHADSSATFTAPPPAPAQVAAKRGLETVRNGLLFGAPRRGGSAGEAAADASMLPIATGSARELVQSMHTQASAADPTSAVTAARADTAIHAATPGRQRLAASAATSWNDLESYAQQRVRATRRRAEPRVVVGGHDGAVRRVSAGEDTHRVTRRHNVAPHHGVRPRTASSAVGRAEQLRRTLAEHERELRDPMTFVSWIRQTKAQAMSGTPSGAGGKFEFVYLRHAGIAGASNCYNLRICDAAEALALPEYFTMSSKGVARITVASNQRRPAGSLKSATGRVDAQQLATTDGVDWMTAPDELVLAPAVDDDWAGAMEVTQPRAAAPARASPPVVAEFTPLETWVREKGQFEAAQQVTFVRGFQRWLWFQCWRRNVVLRRFCRKRDAVRRSLLKQRYAALGVAHEKVTHVINQLSDCVLLEVPDDNGARLSKDLFLKRQHRHLDAVLPVVKQLVADAVHAVRKACQVRRVCLASGKPPPTQQR